MSRLPLVGWYVRALRAAVTPRAVDAAEGTRLALALHGSRRAGVGWGAAVWLANAAPLVVAAVFLAEAGAWWLVGPVVLIAAHSVAKAIGRHREGFYF